MLDLASAVPSYMSSPADTRDPSDTRTGAGSPVQHRHGGRHGKPRWRRRCAFWVAGPLTVVLALMLAAGLALHWAILPHIDDWRPALEKQATQALGVPVHIGAISAPSSGWLPTLDLRDVRLTDARGRDALRLPRVTAALSVRSLLAFELRFSRLLLDSPELLLRRDAQGRVFVAGLSMDGASDAPTSEAAADWFFQQHEFLITNGRIRWVDELRGAPPLELFDLNLRLRNGLRRHDLRIDATPPAGWGQRFTLRGEFTQSLLDRPGALQRWSGQLYAELPRTDLRELRRYLDLPFELNEGDGALRAWLELDKGSPRSLTLDMGLRAVKLRVAPALPELDLAQIAGRLVLRQSPEAFSLEAKQLGFRAGDGLDWPRSDWSVQLRRDQATGRVTGGGFGAQALDLTLGAQILARLPLTEAQRELLKDMAPAGRLNALQAQWEGPLDAPRTYRAKGSLQGLKLAAGTPAPADPASSSPLARPGLSGADLQFDLSDQGGTAQLDVRDGQVTLPGVFEEPLLSVREAHAALNWRAQRTANQPTRWTVQFGDVKVVTDDLQAEVDGTWHSAATRRPHDHGRLDLTGRVERVDATRVLRYLPAVMGRDARRYVRDAIQSGTVHKVQVKLQGELMDFPFDGPRAKNGQFRITAQARDLRLAYVPSHPADGDLPAFNSPWPAMEQVEADLIFDRASMQLRNARARLMGVELTDVQGGIDDLYHHAPVLSIEGRGRGALADGLRYVRASPVAELTGHVLDNTVASGPMALKLALTLPLAHIDATTVKGQVTLAGNDVRIRPDTPLLGQARARVEFDQKGLQIRAGQARVLGGDASFEGGSLADGNMRFTAQGTVTAEALRNAPELGGAQAAARLSGQAPVRFELGIIKGQPEVTVTSSLQGLGVDLPAPLRKSPEESWPLRVTTRVLPAPAGTHRDELRIDAGPLAALWQRDTTAEPRVLRGAVALQEKLPDLPAQGVIARATLQQLNADAWQNALPAAAGADPKAPRDGTHDAAIDAAIAAGYAPSQLALKVQTLQGGGRTLNAVVAGVTRDPAAGWRVSVDAQQLSGFIELRDARADQPGRIFARLARLSVPKSDADSVEQLLDKQPRSVPALDIVIEDFELRGKRLGRLEIEARQQSDARDWKLNRLILRNPEATLSAVGQWAPESGRPGRRTELDWTLEVHDGGRLLERLGQGQVLRAGKGLLTGQLSWQGSPLSPDYPSMGGRLQVSLDAGQFLKAEPGVGRLLGVLSLQSIPRRLMLDFRDIFAEGFAFDHVGGDIRIERGVARSDNLRMRGLQAAVLMEGHADLAAETQDLHVLVVPEINAGGAALAYAAINPAIGLGTFLAQWLLRKPIAAANTDEFRVTGTWTDPRIEQLPRRAQPRSGDGGATGRAAADMTEGDSAP